MTTAATLEKEAAGSDVRTTRSGRFYRATVDIVELPNELLVVADVPGAPAARSTSISRRASLRSGPRSASASPRRPVICFVNTAWANSFAPFASVSRSTPAASRPNMPTACSSCTCRRSRPSSRSKIVVKT